MASGSEDGEIVGEVNEHFDKAGYVQSEAATAAAGKNTSRAASLSLLQQLVPGWGDEDDDLDKYSKPKRKPKKEKKSKKDKKGSHHHHHQSAAEHGTPDAQHQAAEYEAFYGKVSGLAAVIFSFAHNELSQEAISATCLIVCCAAISTSVCALVCAGIS